MPELRAQRLRREASKAQLQTSPSPSPGPSPGPSPSPTSSPSPNPKQAQLAEGEEILLKCNALCAGDGPVLTQLYDASGMPGQP